MLQIRGQNGFLLSCMDPLAQVSGKQEVMETAEHMLETFYPVSPTIDLQKVHVYKENLNCTGEPPAVTRWLLLAHILYKLPLGFIFWSSRHKSLGKNVKYIIFKQAAFLF